MALYRTGDETNSHALQPSGSGIVNVTGDFTWTLSKNRSEVPTAQITEYQINSGQLLAGIYYYFKQVPEAIGATNAGNALRGGGENKEPYEYMYFANPTGFVYHLPYLGDQKFSRSSEFGKDEDLQKVGEALKTFAVVSLATPGSHKLGGLAATGALKDIAKAGASGAIPGKVELMGLNNSKSWQRSGENDYTIEFDLLNTFNDTNEIRKNRELAYLLTHQASPFRRNFAVMDPPCIYQLEIPDVVHLPAAYISDLQIKNLGKTRLLDLDGVPRTIPEGYRFSITFRSLLEASRNIFAGVDNPKNKVRAISQEDYRTALSRDGSRLGRFISDRLPNLGDTDN